MWKIKLILLTGCAVKAFVGLRPKMYSFIVNDGKESEIKKAKGVSKSVVNREISYEQYLDCLFGGDFERHKMCSIRSDNHNLYLKSINKISLSSFDDKRYWLAPHGVQSYSYGHYKTTV